MLLTENYINNMPSIKIERIVSFTSEDPIHTANNILSTDTSKKWKCKEPGEKTAAIVLQLYQPYVISGLDIGNEHSAYIEVLVSRSGGPEEYKVLLVMSSFMTPLEARQSQNVNKVRMFKQEDLSDPERNEKWDRVKIVCTQPFNRHVQYGLSFINLYTNGGKTVENTHQATIGHFTIRPPSPDDISPGSLFAKRKQIKDSTTEKTLKGAAAIREATSLAHTGSPVSVKQKLKHNLPTTPNNQSIDKTDKTDSSSKPRNRNELLYSKDEEDAHDKIDKIIEKKIQEKTEEKEKESKRLEKEKELSAKFKEKKQIHSEKEKKKESNKNVMPRRDLDTQKIDRNRDKQNESIKRKHKEEFGNVTKKQKKVVTKPFGRLLEDVVLVISGIQNPDRASLRSMALSMGAKYNRDWDNTCTHLVCAFTNTPKFNQVKGKGKIVKRNWLEACYNEKKRLPWRRYALDKADKGDESEEEICASEEVQEDEETEANIDIDSDSEIETKEQGSDTEDKIKEIEQKQKKANITDKFDGDTDSDSSSTNIHNNLNIQKKLETFFDDKIFYVDEVFDEETEKRIKQYIVAYKGILANNLDKAVDIIVTNSMNYNVLKDVYIGSKFIAPDWIWHCHNSQKVVSMKDYTYD